MPLIRALFLGVPAGGLIAAGTFFYTTRHIEAVQLSPSDSIFNSKYHQNYNPNKNPTIHDLHIRTVPISQIDPALLRDEESLIQRFTGGIWAGFGKLGRAFNNTWTYLFHY
jgi:hypothetical protein